MRLVDSSTLAIIAVFMTLKCTLCTARTSRLKTLLQSKGNHGKQEQVSTCLSAFNKCSRSGECTNALRGLDKRCKVIDGRCSAEMVDLPRCGLIMDHIFSYGFPSSQCDCPPDSQGCKTMLKKIYSNPCFASIRHLRQFNLFPKEIDAYDRAKSFDVTTTTETTTARVIKTSAVSESKFALFEEVFGDNTASTTQSSKIALSTENNQVLHNAEVARPKRIRNKPRKEVTNPPERTKQISKLRKDATDNDNRSKTYFEVNQAKVSPKTREALQQHLRESPEKEKTANNDADYKSIAIILGVLLGFFILSSFLLFLWTRVNGTFLYTSGKFVRDQRDEEGIHSKSQTNFTPNNLSSANHSIKV